MDARAAILARIQDALGRAPAAPPPIERTYRTTTALAPGSDGAARLLVDRLTDYRANVRECDEAALPGVLGELLAGAGSVVIPPGLPVPWQQALARASVELRTDSKQEPVPAAVLDRTGAVVTAARVAIAETGTIVLDGEPDQGRRAITLVPDHHVCVLRRDQVVATVPEAVAVLGVHPARPLTWISGPSATSDIELVRVEGVHGPRTLDVVVLG